MFYVRAPLLEGEDVPELPKIMANFLPLIDGPEIFCLFKS